MSSNGSPALSDDIDSTSCSNPSNSFYASFKIYINKFSSGGSDDKQNCKTSQKKSSDSATKSKKSGSSGRSGSSSPNKIVRIEQIECDDSDEVFFNTLHEPSSCQKNEAADVRIKVDPPSLSSRGPTPDPDIDSNRSQREISPVFYLEPDDWSDDVMPKPVALTSPTRALSPCGCGKTHNNNNHNLNICCF